MSNTLDENDWGLLLRRIKDGKCTPFLGAGACYGTLPLGSDVAQDWASDKGYPLEDSYDLARVAQFLAVTEDPMSPKEKIRERFKEIPPPNFSAPDEPHGVLADLPLPVYMTTNYDDFMMQALRSRNKNPKQELCRWNKYVKGEPSIFEAEPGFNPTPMIPIVFHLHGHNGVAESLVLTEDDYLDFLVNISKDQELLPARIQRALTGASLLFMGYRIADWDFRVLFRSLVGYLERSIGRAHISVQLVPVGRQAPEEQKAKAQEYLDRYFEELKIRVYWGTCREFAAELRKRWEAFSHAN
jgi:hypothetical protein